MTCSLKRQSITFQDQFSLNIELYRMAQRNLTFCTSENGDKRELTLKALSSFKDMDLHVLNVVLF